MAYPAYPSSLPAPNLRGYNHTLDTGVVTTEMESGLVDIRRKYTAATAVLSATFMFSHEEHTIFMAWLADIANYGVTTFTMELDIGYGLYHYPVTIAQLDKQQRSEYGYNVSCEIFIRNTNPEGLSYEYVEAYVSGDIEQLFNINLGEI